MATSSVVAVGLETTGALGVADHDKQERMELWNAGVTTTPANKDVDSGIQKVAERLVVQADGRPRLFIMRNCTSLINEFGKYQWRSRREGSPAKEEPLKVDDHAMDALRYMVQEVDSGRFIVA